LIPNYLLTTDSPEITAEKLLPDYLRIELMAAYRTKYQYFFPILQAKTHHLKKKKPTEKNT
jgi:hypothetical protein